MIKEINKTHSNILVKTLRSYHTPHIVQTYSCCTRKWVGRVLSPYCDAVQVLLLGILHERIFAEHIPLHTPHSPPPPHLTLPPPPTPKTFFIDAPAKIAKFSSRWHQQGRHVINFEWWVFIKTSGAKTQTEFLTSTLPLGDGKVINHIHVRGSNSCHLQQFEMHHNR